MFLFFIALCTSDSPQYLQHTRQEAVILLGIWRSLLFDDDHQDQDEDKISNDLCLQIWRTIRQSVWMSTKLPEVNGTNLFIIDNVGFQVGHLY